MDGYVGCRIGFGAAAKALIEVTLTYLPDGTYVVGY